MTDQLVLEECGARVAACRIDRNLTQAALAEQAGLSKRTIERLESGAVATQLSSLIRVCRVLGMLERFDLLLPEAVAGPMAQLRQQGKRRQRASSVKVDTPKKPWTWGAKS